MAKKNQSKNLVPLRGIHTRSRKNPFTFPFSELGVNHNTVLSPCMLFAHDVKVMLRVLSRRETRTSNEEEVLTQKQQEVEDNLDQNLSLRIEREVKVTRGRKGNGAPQGPYA